MTTPEEAARAIIKELKDDSEHGETNELGDNILMVACALLAAEARIRELEEAATELQTQLDSEGWNVNRIGHARKKLRRALAKPEETA
jgi:hypothetical protein